MGKLKSFSESISTGSKTNRSILRAAEGRMPSKKAITASRKAVIKDLLRQKLSPKQIRYILLTDHVLVKGKILKSDWTAEEIKGYLMELGISKTKLWSENPRVPAGDNYHSAVGWY